MILPWKVNEYLFFCWVSLSASLELPPPGIVWLGLECRLRFRANYVLWIEEEIGPVTSEEKEARRFQAPFRNEGNDISPTNPLISRSYLLQFE